MCVLTTKYGVKWEVIQLNGRAAYNREQLTILWMESFGRYVIMNSLAKPVFQGSLEECLDSVRFDIN